MAHHKKEEHHKKHREMHEKHEHYKHGGRTVSDGGTKNKSAKSDTGVKHRETQNADDIHHEMDYTGKNDVVRDAKDTKDEFKHGGKVHGKKHKHHMGKHHHHGHKFARGGRAKPGQNPFSSAYVKGIKGDAV